MDKKDKFLGAIFGMAVGDAVGTAVECVPPKVLKKKPLTDMIGGGKFSLLPGQWTDDTSMGLCMAESLLLKKKFVAKDHLKRFHKWYLEGHLSSNGKCFDIGKTCLKSILSNLKADRNHAPEKHLNSAGNGSLMRLAPIPLFYSHDTKLAIEKSAESSEPTHYCDDAMDACKYGAGLILGALNGVEKKKLLSPMYSPLGQDYWKGENEGTWKMTEKMVEVASGSFKLRNPPKIRNGGYVVLSIEAALWAFYRTDDFKSGLLLCVNLGDDADTVGAIYGQIAGAYYGYSGIPKKWIEKLSLRVLFKVYALELFAMSQHSPKKQESSENSVNFLNIQKTLGYCEMKYGEIMRRTDPAPRRYKTMDSFDLDVKKFALGFEKLKKELKGSKETLQECQDLYENFMERIEKQNKVELKGFLGRKKMMAFGGNFLNSIKKN